MPEGMLSALGIEGQDFEFAIAVDDGSKVAGLAVDGTCASGFVKSGSD